MIFQSESRPVAEIVDRRLDAPAVTLFNHVSRTGLFKAVLCAAVSLLLLIGGGVCQKNRRGMIVS